MDHTEAAHILETLAEGRDPDSGARLSNESVLQNVQVVRALYLAAKELTRGASPDRRSFPGPDNAGTPWSEREDNDLLREFESGMKLAEMAKSHGRTQNAIQGRLYRLGKVPAWRPGAELT